MTAEAPRRVRVELGSGGYDVFIGEGLLRRLGELVRAAAPNAARAQVWNDAGMEEAPTACTRAMDAVRGMEEAGLQCTSGWVEADERKKTMATVQRMLEGCLSANAFTRDDVCVSIGGGLTGDVVGFAAAICLRGVKVVQCPTTLLAMVDASVGGKTGVNVEVRGGLLKNMVGAFHQPVLVVADTAMLETLSERQYRAGLAECVKHGVIGLGCVGTEHEGLLEWLEGNAAGLGAREPGLMVELVARNVALKAWIVEGDERETAREKTDRPTREALNLGHTFGHAIETLPGVRVGSEEGLLHGEAVAIGMCAACRCARDLRVLDGKLVERVESLLVKLGLPVRCEGLPESPDVLVRMRRDKKALRRLRLVLPTGDGGRGGCETREVGDKAAVERAIEGMRGG